MGHKSLTATRQACFLDFKSTAVAIGGSSIRLCSVPGAMPGTFSDLSHNSSVT